MRHLSRHHFLIGKLGLCWYDCWAKRYGLEISWGQRALVLVGF